MPRLTGSTPCPAGSHLQLHWLSRPRTVLVVAKPSPEVLVSLVNVVFWLLQRDTTVYVEPSIFHRMTEVTACHLFLLFSGLPMVGRSRLRRALMLPPSAAVLCLPEDSRGSLQLLRFGCHRSQDDCCLLLLMHSVDSQRASQVAVAVHVTGRPERLPAPFCCGKPQ